MRRVTGINSEDKDWPISFHHPMTDMNGNTTEYDDKSTISQRHTSDILAIRAGLGRHQSAREGLSNPKERKSLYSGLRA